MLTFRTLRGASWTVASRLLSRMIDFATLLVLARILTPADFGLTAIAGSFVGIIEMVLEIPIVQALVRLHRIEKVHLDTAFTLGLLRSAFIGTLMAAAAWPIAILYNDDRLFPIVLALSLTPISRSLYSPSMIYFIRDINFRPSFIAEFSGKVIAVAGSFAALHFGAGYWTLVINPMISTMMATTISYWIAPYKPEISLKKLSDFSSFTGWFTSSQIVSALSWQYDRIFLGYYVEKSVIGYYGVASDFSAMPGQTIIGPAMRPLMAAFATIVDNPRRLETAFLKSARLTMIIAVPAGIGIALTADQLVHAFLGDQWSPAAEYLRWLSLAAMFAAYFQPVANLCLAQDRPDIVLRICAVELAIKVVFMTVAFYWGGIIYMIYARVISAFILLFICMFCAKGLTSASIFMQLRNLWQVLISSLVMICAVVSVQYGLERAGVGLISLLVAMTIIGAIVFGGCLHLLGFRMRGLQ